MNEEDDTNAQAQTSPDWMTTQAPKVITITDPVEMIDDNTIKAPKSRKPRRTKAQMLADAAARPDAEIPIVITVQPTGDAAKVMVLATLMAAEDTRDAVVRDATRIVPRRIVPFFRWFDLWIGAFVDTRRRIVYVCPIPMFGIAIRY